MENISQNTKYMILFLNCGNCACSQKSGILFSCKLELNYVVALIMLFSQEMYLELFFFIVFISNNYLLPYLSSYFTSLWVSTTTLIFLLNSLLIKTSFVDL